MRCETIIRFDWAVKRLLRQKENFNILEGFISSLLDEKVTIVEVLEGEKLSNNHAFNRNRLSVIAKNSKEESIVVEIHNNRELQHFDYRSFAPSPGIEEIVNYGVGHSAVKRVYSIGIMYFDIWEGTDYVYLGKTELTGVHCNDTFSTTKNDEETSILKSSKIIFPESYLIRTEKLNKVPATPLEEWVYYFKSGRISENASAPGLPEAREKLQYAALSEEERRQYDEYVAF